MSQSRVDRDRSAPKTEHPVLSVGAGDRKYRKSKKLEYTTQLAEALIKAIGSYTLKLRSEHQRELAEQKTQLQKKINKYK